MDAVANSSFSADWKDRLPAVRGKLRFDASLAPTNWFQVGGPADVLFRPADVEDLAHFIAQAPADVPRTVLGVGSNIIVRDGGLAGIVIRLGAGFTTHAVHGNGVLEVGAGLLCPQAAQLACDAGIGGLEFLSGIPGGIGGALTMNAGAYGREVKDALIKAQVVTDKGEVREVDPAMFNYTYRHSDLPTGWIFTRAWFQGQAGADAAAIAENMRSINAARAETQPIRSRTGGSTFKNPEGYKAWKLVDEAGCRGLQIGDAQMSELHCNFMINLGNATAQDLENLGEEVRKRVRAHSGVELEWEIKRIGRTAEEYEKEQGE